MTFSIFDKQLITGTHTGWTVASSAVFFTPIIHSWLVVVWGDCVAFLARSRFRASSGGGFEGHRTIWDCGGLWNGRDGGRVGSTTCDCHVRASPEGLLWAAAFATFARVSITAPVLSSVVMPLNNTLFACHSLGQFNLVTEDSLSLWSHWSDMYPGAAISELQQMLVKAGLIGVLVNVVVFAQLELEPACMVGGYPDVNVYDLTLCILGDNGPCGISTSRSLALPPPIPWVTTDSALATIVFPLVLESSTKHLIIIIVGWSIEPYPPSTNSSWWFNQVPMTNY